MIRTENRYCACCARTQRFLDLGPKLVCPTCSKQLWRAEPTTWPRIVQLFRIAAPRAVAHTTWQAGWRAG